jgi:hypothetical protein
MIKRAFKYLAIILLNLIVLFAFSKIWQDSLVISLNPNIVFNEQAKIMGFTILSLIGIRILIIYFRKRNIQSVKKKIKYAALLTAIICSYLYIDYAVKIVNNRVLNNETRVELLTKINFMKLSGTKIIDAKELTVNEYTQISKIMGFQSLHKDSKNIGFNYSVSGFLGHEYSINITYNLPLGTEVEEFSVQKDDFTKRQSVEKQDNKLKVKFEENWF